MEKLSDFLNERYIKLELESNNKMDAIKEIASLLKPEVSDFNGFCNDIIDREMVGSTALENGLAIPHVRSKHINGFYVAVGTKKDGIETESLDDKKTTLFFLIATNVKYNDKHLKTLASIIKLLDNATKIKILSNTHSKEGFIGLIKQLERI